MSFKSVHSSLPVAKVDKKKNPIAASQWEVCSSPDRTEHSVLLPPREQHHISVPWLGAEALPLLQVCPAGTCWDKPHHPTLLGLGSPSHRGEGWQGGLAFSRSKGSWLTGRQHSWASALWKTWKMQHKGSELPFLKDPRCWLLAHPYKNRRFSVLM